MFFKQKNKKKDIFLGEGCSGAVRSCVKPFTDVTGEELLNALLIRGKLAYGYENSFTDGEIYIALIKCKHLLNVKRICFWGSEDFDKTFSGRQDFCSNSTIQLIMQNKFNHALHEFEDCIDDYGKGRARTITINEYVLYNCILNCFIAKLEEQSENLECLMLRLLCKVGDKVWIITSTANYSLGEYKEVPLQHPQEKKIQSITVTKNGILYHVKDRAYVEPDFGKTVFLTKEEAEQALAEMQGK